jgi:hypothetical protein
VAFLKSKINGASLNAYLWRYVDGVPEQNVWKSMADLPAKTVASDMMSKDLKKRRFNFVGSTICYAFMQAVGMVNDHTTDCFRYREIKTLRLANKTSVATSGPTLGAASSAHQGLTFVVISASMTSRGFRDE